MVLSRLLGAERERIVSLFVTLVEREQLAPHALHRSQLVDHIPLFLDETIAELARDKPPRSRGDIQDTSPTARQHGEQRWALGYDLEALIREYGVLRHSIFAVAKEKGVAVTLDEYEILVKCLSVGVAEAATAYVAHRDAQVAGYRSNLEFITEAGELLSSSLDYRSTLNRLTSLLVPRLADWCSLHFEGVEDGDIPVAHVDDAKLATLRELIRRFPPPADRLDRQLHRVETGDAQLVSAVTPGYFEQIATSPEHLALLRAVGTRSWIVVSLKVQDHVFGSLVLAYSDSNRHYDTESVRVAREIARRAAVAIDNARLYDLSQSERSRVEATTRAKDEFVAMVSHELRTPLNAILGWLRLLRAGTVAESKREHALDIIERNAKTQDHLVADLLDISKVITGKLRITSSQVDLSDVVEIAVEGVRVAAEAKRIRIRTELASGEAIMRGDGDRLRQIVWNLVSNAVKFTPKDGEVEVRLERVESDLQLVVQDNGEGIEPSFLPHVFESFQQSDTSFSRKFGGLGIGLSITKHLVELHGGSIIARSDGPGTGATFTVRLPISPLLSTTLGVRRVSATTTDGALGIELPPGMEELAVLVVDDDEDARELVTFVLEHHGMRVHAVGSVAEAMAALAGHVPDVIVSDIGMPDANGYSFIRNVRTTLDDGRKNIPAIALTASGRIDDRNRALVEGFNLHLTKPVEPLLLVRSIIELARDVRR